MGLWPQLFLACGALKRGSPQRKGAALRRRVALTRTPTADHAPEGGWVRRADIGFWQDTEARGQLQLINSVQNIIIQS